MIVYPLACPQDHFFEGWFASPEACEKQARDGQLQCPSCGSAEVRKLPAAPHVHTSAHSSDPAKPAVPAPAPEGAKLRGDAIKAVREYILANTENVGRHFAEVARRIHYKEEEERAIRGQVTHEEAESLREEGVPAYPISSEIIPSEEIH